MKEFEECLEYVLSTMKRLDSKIVAIRPSRFSTYVVPERYIKQFREHNIKVTESLAHRGYLRFEKEVSS